MKGLGYDRGVVGDERSLFDKYGRLIIVGSLGILAYLVSTSHLFSWVSPTQKIRSPGPKSDSCNTFEKGYQCSPEISHFWGQYSPYFSLEDQSTISAAVPEDCQVTFVQVLSRHGARYPTTSKSRTYAKLISKIQRHVTSFGSKYEFLKTYKYTLGANDLTTFGENQMVDSGLKFYQRYQALSRNVVPFIRASDSDRVIVSGELFIQGFQNAKLNDHQSNQDQAAPVISVIIPEGASFNNSLDHSICTDFEESKLASKIKNNFTELFATAIRERLENDLPGVNLSYKNIVHLMDMCSFDTVARTSDVSQLSPFCGLFTQKEWVQYDYLQSLAKYYGYGAGNPLGPAQGIGFANELIARMTQSPVQDHTNTNHTLDSDPATFPLNATIYIDFSHDNGITPILFALGLYNGTTPLSQTSVVSIEASDGYSASWTVPFGSRAYIEMMQCGAQEEPFVRALVNDRVVPLHGCSVDDLGRCRRDDFIRGLSFVQSGGNWDQCFL